MDAMVAKAGESDDGKRLNSVILRQAQDDKT